MTTLPNDLTLGTGRSIGRYFGLVSAIPTLVLTGYLALLIATGAWSARPDFRQAFDELGTLSLVGIVAVLAAALIVALALHSLQFTIVQLLEGYWGGNPILRNLRTRRTAVHVGRFNRALVLLDTTMENLEILGTSNSRGQMLVDQADAERIIDSYPEVRATEDEPADLEAAFLPTRLGNILRRYELRAGQPYGLDALTQMTQLALVAEPRHVAYLQDQRSAMGLSARVCASGLVATFITLMLMLPWDVWMLFAIIPYGVAYVAYRGTLIAARQYGDALEAVITLNRFRLYQGLHLQLPADTSGERELNDAWDRIRASAEEFSIAYDHSALANSGDVGASITSPDPRSDE